MSHKPGQAANIDSPMTGHPPVKGLASAPGVYSRHRNLGPAGVDGGMPLKFYDDAIKTPELQATDNPMFVTPTKRTTS